MNDFIETEQVCIAVSSIEPASISALPGAAGPVGIIQLVEWQFSRSPGRVKLSMRPLPTLVKDGRIIWEGTEQGAVLDVPEDMPVGEFFDQLRAMGSGPGLHALLGSALGEPIES